MWAQEWGNIYDVVAPTGAGDVGYDLTELLVAKKYTPEKMVRTGEGFFTSLGLRAAARDLLAALDDHHARATAR